MILAAKTLRDQGELPPTVADPSLYRLRGTEVTLPKDANWVEATEPWLKAFSAGPPPENTPRQGRRQAQAPRIGVQGGG